MAIASPNKMPFDDSRYEEYNGSVTDLKVKIFVMIQRIAVLHGDQVNLTVRAAGLTAAQYNVLRILRAAGTTGRSCNEIAGRMITRDPDMTRLLDKLVMRQLVVRSRSLTDRRVVTARITPAGTALLASLDEPVALLHEQQFAALNSDSLETLFATLEKIR
jgi:DNA-binding MarR family transcriptional regulator